MAIEIGGFFRRRTERGTVWRRTQPSASRAESTGKQVESCSAPTRSPRPARRQLNPGRIPVTRLTARPGYFLIILRCSASTFAPWLKNSRYAMYRQACYAVKLSEHPALHALAPTTALIIDFSSFGEPNAACAAVEQFNLKLIFQFRHSSAADGRYAHLQPSGCVAVKESNSRQLWRIPTFVLIVPLFTLGLKVI